MLDVSLSYVVLVVVAVGVVLDVGVVFFFLQLAGFLYPVLYPVLYLQVEVGAVVEVAWAMLEDKVEVGSGVGCNGIVGCYYNVDGIVGCYYNIDDDVDENVG
jgi:hypothetical protein